MTTDVFILHIGNSLVAVWFYTWIRSGWPAVLSRERYLMVGYSENASTRTWLKYIFFPRPLLTNQLRSVSMSGQDSLAICIVSDFISILYTMFTYPLMPLEKRTATCARR